MYAKIGPKLSQYWPNLRPFQSRTDRRPYLAQDRANMRPRTGPILATPVPGWSWARNRPEMWPVSGTKMVPDLPYFNPQYWYISCSDLETKSHLDRNTLMDVTCPDSWKMHIFLSLGQHPVDRIPPTHKQPGIPHIRLSIFIAVHKNLPDPSYFNLRDPHTHDVRNSEQFRK